LPDTVPPVSWIPSQGILLPTHNAGSRSGFASNTLVCIEETKLARLAYPQSGPLGRHLHIHRSPTKPENAYVAVQYREWWFYIDGTDRPTKRFFHLLTVLWSVRIAESAAKAQKAPLLMLPASR
jgi:hypothetical protein